MRFARLLTAVFVAVSIGMALPDGVQATEKHEADETAATDSEEERIEELERRVEVLVEEIDALHRGGEPEPEEPAPESRPGRWGVGPAAAKVYERERGVSIGGYGEWLYENFDAERDDGSSADVEDVADFLRLVLYTGYKFDDRIVFNSEIEFEHASTGENGEVSVEFAYLDFLVNPRFNVRTGLVLVPVGLINEIHEPPTFLGARRPDVERLILPTTWRELGAGVFGDAGPFTYRAYLTTSLDGSGFSAANGIRGGRQGASQAVAEDFAVSGRLDYTGFPGLLAGVSAFRGDSGQGGEVDGEVVDGTVETFDAHVDWKWRGLEARALWARTELDDAAELSVLAGETIGSRMTGWYVEAGYDVLSATRWNRRELVPFARFCAFETQDEVSPALAATVDGSNDREVRTLGLVFRPISRIAVKLEHQDRDNGTDDAVDQFNAAVGFSF